MNLNLLCLSLVLVSNYYVLTSNVDNNKMVENKTSQLIAVAVIFRHGDRAPFVSFPRDKFCNLTYWPMGYGHLTKQGIQRMYKLGQWLRLRYETFLSEIYSPQDIYVHSTNIDRCLMSATVALAGLYPPKEDQIWNDQLHWQPIPVHIAVETNLMSEPCRKFDKLYAEVKNVIYNAFEKQYTDIFKMISDHTGWKNVTMYEVKTLRSVMYCYRNYNKSFIPKWWDKIDPKILDYIAGVHYSLSTATASLIRLRVGVFYNYLFNYFDKFVNSSQTNEESSNPKFMMMSSHDTTIAPILNGMGLYRMKPIEFGDTMIIELRKTHDGRYIVNIFYKFEDKLEELTLQECGFDCDYHQLKMNLKEVTMDINTRRIECAENHS